MNRAETIRLTALEIGAELLYERWQEASAAYTQAAREREELGDLLGELAYEGRIKGYDDPSAEIHDPTGTLARVREALTKPEGETHECPTCHGEGVVTVGGMSVNPSSGVLVSDPEEAHDERCPNCTGSGTAREAAA